MQGTDDVCWEGQSYRTKSPGVNRFACLVHRRKRLDTATVLIFMRKSWTQQQFSCCSYGSVRCPPNSHPKGSADCNLTTPSSKSPYDHLYRPLRSGKLFVWGHTGSFLVGPGNGGKSKPDFWERSPVASPQVLILEGPSCK